MSRFLPPGKTKSLGFERLAIFDIVTTHSTPPHPRANQTLESLDTLLKVATRKTAASTRKPKADQHCHDVTNASRLAPVSVINKTPSASPRLGLVLPINPAWGSRALGWAIERCLKFDGADSFVTITLGGPYWLKASESLS